MKNPPAKTKILSLTLALGLLFAHTASAEVLIFSNEQQEENSNLLILDNDDTGGDVILQFGNLLSEQLYWDEASSRFVFTDDLQVQGNLDTEGVITAGSNNITITTTEGYLDGNQIATDSINEGSLNFGTALGQIGADDLPINTAGMNNTASSNTQGAIGDLDSAIGNRNYTENNYLADGETVTASLDRVDQQLQDNREYTDSSLASNTGTNSDTFTLDQDGTGGNVTLQFGSNINEQVYWDDASGQFVVTDDLDVQGNVTLSGTVDGVDVSNLNTTVNNLDSTLSGHLDGSANQHDASEIDVETIGNITTASDLETNLGSIDTAIGDRDYTANNVVTDGESVTSSIDALDQAITGATSSKTQFIAMNDMNVVADGTNNRVNLYNDIENGVNPHRYYLLKSRQSTLQDLDLKFKLKLPNNFQSFANSNDLSFFYKNTGTSAAESKIDLSVEDADGDTAFVPATDLFNLAWSEYTNEFTNPAFDPTPGEYIYVTIKGYSSAAGSSIYSPYIGEIVIQYTTTGF